MLYILESQSTSKDVGEKQKGKLGEAREGKKG